MALLLASSGLEVPAPPPPAVGMVAVEPAAGGLAGDGIVEGAAHWTCGSDGSVRGAITLRGTVRVAGIGVGDVEVPVSGSGALRGSCIEGEAELYGFVMMRGSSAARGPMGRAIVVRVEDGTRLGFHAAETPRWMKVPVVLRAHTL